ATATPACSILSLHDALPISVTLGLSREGQPLTVKVQLAARPKSFAFIDGKPFKFEMPPVNIPPIEIPEIDIPSMDVVVHSSTRRSEEHTSELQSLAYLVCRL